MVNLFKSRDSRSTGVPHPLCRCKEISLLSTSATGMDGSGQQNGTQRRVAKIVVEDGRYVAAYNTYNQPNQSCHFDDNRKANSLPGFTNRSAHHNFENGFAVSRVPFFEQSEQFTTQQHFSNNVPKGCASYEHIPSPSAKHVTSESIGQDKKVRQPFLGKFFNRRKKNCKISTNRNSSNSSDSEDLSERRSWLKRKMRKKKLSRSSPSIGVTQTKQSNLSNDNRNIHNVQCERAIPPFSPPSIKHVSTSCQTIGIPILETQNNNKEMSLSYDSLPVSRKSCNSESAYGSFNSMSYQSPVLGGENSSTDTLTRKEKREALMARVEKLREHNKLSSSDEDCVSHSSHPCYKSNSGGLCKRDAASRTERYLRRKSHELETLRKESEKDKRSKAAVQARIQEIRNVKLREAQRSASLVNKQESEDTKPKWSARLVYQESNEYDSVVLATPSDIPPFGSTNQKYIINSKPEYQSIPCHSTNKPYKAVSFQSDSHNSNGRLSHRFDGTRSISYDNDINKAASLPPNSSCATVTYTQRYPIRTRKISPTPPPRDSSRFLSPKDPHRPISYSFENISHVPIQTTKPSIYLNRNEQPHLRDQSKFHSSNSVKQNHPQFPLRLGRRACSEQRINEAINTNNPLTQIPAAKHESTVKENISYNCNDTSPWSSLDRKKQFLFERAISPPQTQTNSRNSNRSSSGIIRIPNMPPSPSSDYSSGISENSLKYERSIASTLEADQSNHFVTHMNEQNNRHSRIETNNDNNINELNSPAAQNSMKDPLKGFNNLASSSNDRLKEFNKLPNSTKDPLKRGSSLANLPKEPLKGSNSLANSSTSLYAESAFNHHPIKTNSSSAHCSRTFTGKQLNNNEEIRASSQTKVPEPPKRNSSNLTKSTRELLAKQFQLLVGQSNLDTEQKNSAGPNEENEKIQERLKKNKSADFENAIKELEDIYKNLNLNIDDILDGAERRDLPTEHQRMWAQRSSHDSLQEATTDEPELSPRGRSTTPKLRRSYTPDKVKDDLHFRSCQKTSLVHAKKKSELAGSYLLVSPLHGPPPDDDTKTVKDISNLIEPNIISDDMSYIHIRKANSIKIIDPQPPFGVPLGPHTQSSPTDYLHSEIKENYRPMMTNRRQPDVTMDDMAFRNLRKGTSSTKSLNLSGLDDVLSETRVSCDLCPPIRSASVDRVMNTSSFAKIKQEIQTARQVRHLPRHKGRRKFSQIYREVLTDSESAASYQKRQLRNQILKEARKVLTGELEESSSDTETTMTFSQPTIRQAIITESRCPNGRSNETNQIQSDTNSASDTSNIFTYSQFAEDSGKNIPGAQQTSETNISSSDTYKTDNKVNDNVPYTHSGEKPVSVDITKLLSSNGSFIPPSLETEGNQLTSSISNVEPPFNISSPLFNNLQEIMLTKEQMCGPSLAEHIFLPGRTYSPPTNLDCINYSVGATFYAPNALSTSSQIGDSLTAKQTDSDSKLPRESSKDADLMHENLANSNLNQVPAIRQIRKERAINLLHKIIGPISSSNKSFRSPQSFQNLPSESNDLDAVPRGQLNALNEKNVIMNQEDATSEPTCQGGKSKYVFFSDDQMMKCFSTSCCFLFCVINLIDIDILTAFSLILAIASVLFTFAV